MYEFRRMKRRVTLQQSDDEAAHGILGADSSVQICAKKWGQEGADILELPITSAHCFFLGCKWRSEFFK